MLESMLNIGSAAVIVGTLSYFAYLTYRSVDVEELFTKPEKKTHLFEDNNGEKSNPFTDTFSDEEESEFKYGV